MKKTKKNKSILKRILAFLGAGVCALACMLTFGYDANMTAYARDFDEYYSYNSMEHNVKISNNGSFSKNIVDINDFVSGDIVSSGTKYANSDIYFRTNSFISVISNSKYTLSYHGVNKLLLVGVKKYLANDMSSGSQYLDIRTFPYTFVIPDNVKYIKLVIKPQDVSSLNDIDIQLETGDVATSYVPYQQNDFISFNTTLVSYPFVEYSTNFTSCYFDFYYDGYTYGTLDYISGITNKNVFSLYTDNKSTLLNNKVTFYAYDINTKAIDYNNSFYFYIMADYINENNSYDNLSIFNSNVVKVIRGSHLDFNKYFKNKYTQDPAAYGCTKYNFISYVDLNNNSVNIFIPLFNDNDRMYYKFNIFYLDNSTLEDYINGYKNGSLDGYNKGYDKGKNDGYNSGYDVGVDFGYSGGYHDGFNKGVSESNDYTFLGLISACIDAPITYFTNLFNFELLGVNLSAFLTGLFTLCVIVTIVKMCLGGR